jgi:hypothetical protein
MCAFSKLESMPLLTSMFMGCMIVITVLYVHIYFIVRRHRRQIAALLPQGMAPAANVHIRSSVTSLYFIGVCIIFKCPGYIIATLVLGDSSLRSTVTDQMSYYLMTWGFLNSLVNPVLYAWKIAECRLYVALIVCRFNKEVTERCRHRLHELV